MGFRVNPRGLVPTRTLNGGTSFRAGPMRPTRANNRNIIFPGDAVYLDTSGRIQRALVATAAGQPWLGVVAAVYDKKGKARTFAQPNGSAYIAASTTGFVQVYEDPDIIYTVNCSASIGEASIGQYANIVLNANNTAAGISGMCVDGVDVTATSIGHPLQIMAVSQNEAGGFPEPYVTDGTNQDVEVRIAQHLWRGLRRTVMPT